MIASFEEERAAVTVVLADHQAVYRAGLRASLSAGRNVRVVGEASDGVEALRLCAANKPSVLIFDLEIPNGGYAILSRLAQASPGTRALVLSSREGRDHEERGLSGGACGFLSKSAPESNILRATRAVARGEVWAPRRSTSRILGVRATRVAPGRRRSLSRREREVLRFLALGLRNRDIAEELGSSEKTIASQVASIVAKLDVRNRVVAALAGRRLLAGSAGV